jgi:CDP-diacylglycerol---serine O-phosphatidyltransferase
MIRFIFDPANALTALGLSLAVLAVGLTAHGRFELAAIAALWALLIDHFDGVVASRTAARIESASLIGKQLDSFADIVSAGVFPAVLLFMVVRPSNGFGAVAAILICFAAALRLSYYNVFGLHDDGAFHGLPVTYNVPAIALLVALRPLLAESHFSVILTIVVLVLAALHVSPLRVPRLRGIGYAIISAYVVLMTLVLGKLALS